MAKQTKERVFHHVIISVFCKPYDDESDVLKGLDLLSPVPTGVLLMQDPVPDPERPHTTYYRMPDIELTVQVTPTDDGKMTIFTLFFKKMSAVNNFAKLLSNTFTNEERKEYEEQPELLLDMDGRLTCRFDKDLLMSGKCSLTEDGNCYQVKASIAAYPKTEESMLAVIQRILAKTS